MNWDIAMLGALAKVLDSAREDATEDWAAVGVSFQTADLTALRKLYACLKTQLERENIS